MFSEEAWKQMMELFSNPLFKKSLFDFNVKMQQEGIEAAKRFWNMNPAKDSFPFGAEMFEKMADFYIILGFVPHYKYDEALKEKERLQKENEFLKETIKQLQMNLFSEAGERAQQVWESIISKQFEMHKDLSKNILELFKGLK
jgi:tetratricopeptide (TPR) repeat protein